MQFLGNSMQFLKSSLRTEGGGESRAIQHESKYSEIGNCIFLVQPKSPMRPILALRCIPSTSRLPVRQLSTSVRANAASTANLPKRDKTEYGVRIPNAKARKDWPKQAETDTAAHPLWRFFHAEQSLEAPDKRLDNSSTSIASSSSS